MEPEHGSSAGVVRCVFVLPTYLLCRVATSPSLNAELDLEHPSPMAGSEPKVRKILVPWENLNVEVWRNVIERFSPLLRTDEEGPLCLGLQTVNLSL